jgi:hypothetical protein
MTRRTRIFIGMAASGAIPLTVGVIMWVVGSAMGLVSHHGWGQIAGIGAILILAGLLCGAALLIATAAWRRGMPRLRIRAAGQAWHHGGEHALVPMPPPGPQMFRPQPPSGVSFPPSWDPYPPFEDQQWSAAGTTPNWTPPADQDYPEFPRDRGPMRPDVPGEGRHRKLLRRVVRR